MADYTFECLGFAMEGDDPISPLLGELLPHAEQVAHAEALGLTSLRWTDPSGARLTFTVTKKGLHELVLSVEAEPSVTVSGLLPLGDTLVAADVIVDGELVTRAVVDLEQARHLTQDVDTIDVAVVGLGVDMSIHESPQTFGASDASLLDPDNTATNPETGKPMRLAAESFISYGIFGEPQESEPRAFMAATVVDAETRTNTWSGRDFHVVGVTTLGFSATVCLSARDHPSPPVAGNVVAGTVHLVASNDSLWELQPSAPAKRGWRPASLSP